MLCMLSIIAKHAKKKPSFNLYMPRDFLTLNTLMQKAFLFLQTVASSKKQQGEILNHLFFE